MKSCKSAPVSFPVSIFHSTGNISSIDFHEIFYLENLLKSVRALQFWLKSCNTDRYFS